MATGASGSGPRPRACRRRHPQLRALQHGGIRVEPHQQARLDGLRRHRGTLRFLRLRGDCQRHRHHPDRRGDRPRHRNPIGRRQQVDWAALRRARPGAPREQTLRAGDPPHRAGHDRFGKAARAQFAVDGLRRDLRARVHRLRDRQQLRRRHPLQVPGHEDAAKLARHLRAPQQRVGIADRASLRPRARHQLFLPRADHARAGRGRDAQPRIEVQLAQPHRVRRLRRQRLAARLRLAVDRRGDRVVRSSRQHALERALEWHPRLVGPRRQRVGAGRAQRALHADRRAFGRRANVGRPLPALLMSSAGGFVDAGSSGRGCSRRTSVSKLPAGPVANSHEW